MSTPHESDHRRPAAVSQAFGEALEQLRLWLRALESAPHLVRPPSPAASAELEQLLQEVWTTGGLPSQPGLGRESAEQRAFRDWVGPFFWQSDVMRRCFEKPRGYAGDFLMMEAIYKNVPHGATPLGRWLDAWVLAQPGFEAVRNRRDKIAGLLADAWNAGARRVLNVACGAAPELVSIARSVKFDSLVLMDQDQGAVDAAVAAMGRSALPATSIAALHPWCGSVLGLLRTKSRLVPRSQDIIYSIGLYDYLSDRLAVGLTARLWEALGPGGLLAVGNFNGHHPMRHLIEAAMDWYLIYRDGSDMEALARGLPGLASLEVYTEPTGCLHLLLARKTGTPEDA